jgi:hypothetical protein
MSKNSITVWVKKKSRFQSGLPKLQIMFPVTVLSPAETFEIRKHLSTLLLAMAWQRHSIHFPANYERKS